MASSNAHIGKPALEFQVPPEVDGAFKKVKLSEYKGNYRARFFSHLQFTSVCPTETMAFSNVLWSCTSWTAGCWASPWTLSSFTWLGSTPPRRREASALEHPPAGPCNQKLLPWLWSQGRWRYCLQGPLYHWWQGWSLDHPQWFVCGVLSGWGSVVGPGLTVHRGAWGSLSHWLDARQSHSQAQCEPQQGNLSLNTTRLADGWQSWALGHHLCPDLYVPLTDPGKARPASLDSTVQDGRGAKPKPS